MTHDSELRYEVSFAENDALDGLFHASAADGVRASTKVFEDVVASLHDCIDRFRDERTDIIRFPPVMSRSVLRRNGYEQAFPHLLGCVCGVDDGGRATAERPDSEAERATLPGDSLVLTPAACYPVYPLAAARGLVPRGGWTFDVSSDCFRREASRDIERFQSFRMREFVRFGSETDIGDHIANWIERGRGMMTALGLSPTLAEASDPFFGQTAAASARMQSRAGLKQEMLLPIRPGRTGTACMSFNNHREHFSRLWSIDAIDGGRVHSACVGFGMERLALALFARHGPSPKEWPRATRACLDA